MYIHREQKRTSNLEIVPTSPPPPTRTHRAENLREKRGLLKGYRKNLSNLFCASAGESTQ